MADRRLELMLLNEAVTEALLALEGHFTDDMEVNFLARSRTRPDGHILIGASEPEDVIRAVRDLLSESCPESPDTAG